MASKTAVVLLCISSSEDYRSDPGARQPQEWSEAGGHERGRRVGMTSHTKHTRLCELSNKAQYASRVLNAIAATLLKKNGVLWGKNRHVSLIPLPTFKLRKCVGVSSITQNFN